MRESLADEQLLGAAMKGESWATWRALLIAAAGEELLEDERALFKGVTGRKREPGAIVDTMLAVAGRRSGKSTAMAVFITWLATLCDWSDARSLGERAVAAFSAPKVDQANRIARYVRAFIRHSPILSKLIRNETQTLLELENGVDVIVEPANWRTTRGVTAVGVCLAESALLLPP